VYLKSVPGEHRPDENFPNFMDVAFRRAEHHDAGSRALGTQPLEFRIEHCHGSAHRFGGGHHVGKEHLPAGELLADVMHAWDKAVIDGIDGRDAGCEGFFRQAGSSIGRAFDDVLPHGGEVVVWHKVSRPC
jgi:hypothetical protein